MIRYLHKGSQRFAIKRFDDTIPEGERLKFGDVFSASSFLRSMLFEWNNEAALRDFLPERFIAFPPHCDQREVANQLAFAIVSETLEVYRLPLSDYAVSGSGKGKKGGGSKKTPVPPPPPPPPPEDKEKVEVEIRAEDGVSEPPKHLCADGSVRLKAVPSKGGGTYKWTTSSSNITLTNDTSQTVTVEGINPSASENAEKVRLDFTPSSGTKPGPKTAELTVVRVRFSESANMVYGYDDMDGDAGAIHHVSVKKNGSTVVKVTIEGGVSGDKLFFTSDNTSVADTALPESPGAEFDLTINGKAQDKAEAKIEARVNGETGPACAAIFANVYEEKAVEATVAKIYDSQSASTTLSHPDFDVEAAETDIDEWYKPAVASIELTDHSATGQAVDIRFDLNGNGKLDLEPGATSAEQQAINAAFNPAGQKIVIVKDLSWAFYLKTAASAGDLTIELKDSYASYMKYIVVGNSYTLGSGGTAENITVASKSGTTVTLSAALANAHPTTDALYWPLSGLSGNPIYVQEGTKTLAKIRQTIGHECGHSLMRWLDLDESVNLMHFSSGRTDTEIRYKEKPKKYEAGNESQWQKITR